MIKNLKTITKSGLSGFDSKPLVCYKLCCAVGQILTVNIFHRGVAQLGGAPGLGPGGRRFESCHLDFFMPIFLFQYFFGHLGIHVTVAVHGEFIHRIVLKIIKDLSAVCFAEQAGSCLNDFLSSLIS